MCSKHAGNQFPAGFLRRWCLILGVSPRVTNYLRYQMFRLLLVYPLFNTLVGCFRPGYYGLACVLRIVGYVLANAPLDPVVKYRNLGWTLQRKAGREEFGEEMEKEDRRVRKETRENGLS
ncbi:hypothetical protein M404DRAFT_999058 [Pisolithus tinctorius Marx 270]|uniref:Uncharacterized protein n=1 Tax=Pisolithus tinctorius Marx 270 TaxID=870435 RepID=A0A0C3PE21_PISTI|nr:hypothetical protein M404DRAFT_999058 [Pisolithus tinctorius Marx 270]